MGAAALVGATPPVGATTLVGATALVRATTLVGASALEGAMLGTLVMVRTPLTETVNPKVRLPDPPLPLLEERSGISRTNYNRNKSPSSFSPREVILRTQYSKSHWS